MATDPLSRHFSAMAYNNAWANQRLLAACAQLSQEEFVAPRTSFFPSLKATLNHNLTVDWYYVDALERFVRRPAGEQHAFAASSNPRSRSPRAANCRPRSAPSTIG